MKKRTPLYEFDKAKDGTFRVSDADQAGLVYFPLCNEAGMLSSITPSLQGDIKLDQHSFLLEPVSFEDLRTSRAARNFWMGLRKDGKSLPWSVTGQSTWQRSDTYGPETTKLEAGILWQKTTRSNSKLGLEASVLSFVPSIKQTVEVMFVEIKNTSKKQIEFTATAAIPMYGRSADNLRDHRHVTSLLHRVQKEKFGVFLKPTMCFNERGHLINHIGYFVIGCDEKGNPPAGVFGTRASFVGEQGDLEQPLALVQEWKPALTLGNEHQGQEAMGALQFKKQTLKPGQTASFTVLLGIDREPSDHNDLMADFSTRNDVLSLLEKTKQEWDRRLSTIQFQTGNAEFDQWVRWVQLQPILRKLFGCSFLPDFDYGRGGRGWRDLWQDCLALLLQNPEEVREDLIRNFGGVRIDGSNATIIGRKPAPSKNGQLKWMPEFIADRNNIARTWMDHGVWPFLTTLLYLNQTGDWDALFEKVPYFRDKLIARGKRVDPDWADSEPTLKTKNKQTYLGTILEHILIETLVPFFNVGEHNIIRLEDADWNDGLDMAHARGESVAFTSLYGGNLEALANLLQTLNQKTGLASVLVADELLLLLDRLDSAVDYDSIEAKKKRLTDYFDTVSKTVSGSQTPVPVLQLIDDLTQKAAWIRRHINNKEWIQNGSHAWFNGYYDNVGRRVEGKGSNGSVRMTLAGQVYPIMVGMADPDRVEQMIKSVNEHLWDEKLGGVRLNTNFGGLEPDLGRAFSFAFGEKENGAVFSHMAVMYANALYQRRFGGEGHKVLKSLFDMAINNERSRIFPGLPEYFNNEGRGRYAYLTGSASWYVLTLLTQAFGVRGEGGDLVLAPQLEPDQFDSKQQASVVVRFAGKVIRVIYTNPKKLMSNRYSVASVKSHEASLPSEIRSDGSVLIKRSALVTRPSWTLEVQLDKRG